MYEVDLALTNQQRLICQKSQTTNQKLHIYQMVSMYVSYL